LKDKKIRLYILDIFVARQFNELYSVTLPLFSLQEKEGEIKREKAVKKRYVFIYILLPKADKFISNNFS
jgi:hypothetical protein